MTNPAPRFWTVKVTAGHAAPATYHGLHFTKAAAINAARVMKADAGPGLYCVAVPAR
jgi:hypothetical protein